MDRPLRCGVAGCHVLAPHMPPWGLLAIAVGMIWLALWRSRLRLPGVAAIALGLASPCLCGRRICCMAEARLIAVRAPSGVFLQQVSGGSKFTANPGCISGRSPGSCQFRAQGEAAKARSPADQEACLLRPLAGARGALLVRGATHPGGCGEASVIVSAEPARGLCPRPWPALVDRFTVWRYGAAAIWLDGGHARILTDRAFRGARPWVPPLPVPRSRVVPPTLKPALVDTGPGG